MALLKAGKAASMFFLTAGSFFMFGGFFALFIAPVLVFIVSVRQRFNAFTLILETFSNELFFPINLGPAPYLSVVSFARFMVLFWE